MGKERWCTYATSGERGRDKLLAEEVIMEKDTSSRISLLGTPQKRGFKKEETHWVDELLLVADALDCEL